MLIEHYAGAFPLGSLPCRRCLPITDATEYAKRSRSSSSGRLPRRVDARNEKMNAKIREPRCRKCRTCWSRRQRSRSGESQRPHRGKEGAGGHADWREFVEKIKKLIQGKSHSRL